MLRIPFILFLILFSGPAGAQPFPKTRSAYFELAGSGGFGSLNYERSFRQVNHTVFAWRVGLSLSPIDRNNGTSIVFPVMVHSITGSGTHKLDIGLGQGITITTKGNFFALTTAAVGYRHQSAASNWFWRLSFTPLISYLGDFHVQPWFGFSIGYTFKTASE